MVRLDDPGRLQGNPDNSIAIVKLTQARLLTPGKSLFATNCLVRLDAGETSEEAALERQATRFVALEDL